MAYEKKTERAPDPPDCPIELLKLFYELDRQGKLNFMACVLSEWTAVRMCESKKQEMDRLFEIDHSTLSNRGITMLARLTMGLRTPNRERFMAADYVKQAVLEILPKRYAMQVLNNQFSAPNEIQEEEDARTTL